MYKIPFPIRTYRKADNRRVGFEAEEANRCKDRWQCTALGRQRATLNTEGPPSVEGSSQSLDLDLGAEKATMID
jgi:hypothetical protein